MKEVNKMEETKTENRDDDIDNNTTDINLTENYELAELRHDGQQADAANNTNGEVGSKCRNKEDAVNGKEVWVYRDPNSNGTTVNYQEKSSIFSGKEHNYMPIPLGNGGDGDVKTLTKEEEAQQDAVKSPIRSPIVPRVYYRRWLMLIVFCCVSMSNAAQWIQYATISNVVREYYNIGYLTVDWLSMIYMLVYIPLIFPVTWLLEREQGLKVIGVLAGSLNCAGAWLRYAGSVPETFWLAFMGQTTVSIAQVFILGMPAHVAATWFGANEVSTACAIGVFGNQVGILLALCVISNNKW